MANLNLKVSSVIERFYDVKEDVDIKGLYEVRPLGNSTAEVLWYFFSSNNATYNKKSDSVVIRDINQCNSSYIDRLIAAYDKAKKYNKKIFWLVFVYGSGIGLEPVDMEWIASVEVLVDLKDLTSSLSMRDFPRGISVPGAWAPCCRRVDQDKYFNTTFISCKDAAGTFVKDYMEKYFELFDNRPFHDFVNAAGVEKIDLKYLFSLNNAAFAEKTMSLLEKHDAIDDEIYENMTDAVKSQPITHMTGFPVLKEVPASVNTPDLLSDFVKCGTSRNRYYSIKHIIRGKEYVVSNNWYYESVSNPDNRTPFVEWIIEALKRNGVIAYISTNVVKGAENIILYGVPGVGKSHYINENYLDSGYENVRVVFHPDYTYSDFTGQIMPRIDAANGGKLKYEFVPGPFTEILKTAVYNPSKKVYLVIEEINRGNAAAIFGELFQLLDRLDSGESEYGITNYEIAKYVYGNPEIKIKLPSNLWILGTMNTADQNVFTIDTAFQRRWEMKRIPNDVKNSKYSKTLIEKSQICWGAFATVANNIILQVDQELGGSSDKRLGAYFVSIKSLNQDQFPEKVLKYLWDDALKMEQNKLFKTSLAALDDVITSYEANKGDPVKDVVNETVYSEMLSETDKLLGVTTTATSSTTPGVLTDANNTDAVSAREADGINALSQGTNAVNADESDSDSDGN